MEQNNVNLTNNFRGAKRNLPRDVFLHLFSMVALYWSAIALITLLWQYINYFFPDVLQYYRSNLWSIRFAVSSLIIVFPLFILASWQLNKIYRRESEVRHSKIRKWLIYLTLFITALVIIGDLVTVVFNFLGGEITLRFILKALSVLAVATAIFGYYLDDVKKELPSSHSKQFALTAGAVVLIAVAGAFFIIGSPQKARLAQLDNQRVSDLQNIQWQIVNYWQKKGEMPKALDVLKDPISGYAPPNDPQTKESYEYNLISEDELKFELCAVFSSDSFSQLGKSVEIAPRGEILQNWSHKQGRTCFERQIDPELYLLQQSVQVKPAVF